MAKVVGGGAKKILYTLNTLKKIGIKKSAKALLSNNTCKACGLGMGGQLGGMTNELGEFPSVCNKSIQAQSSDIQAAIPNEIFKHSVDELRELSPHELEHIGRLNTPLYKAKGAQHFKPVDWDWAIDYGAQKFQAVQPDKSFFYTSGRSSNEAGFLLQLAARAYGTNNINNCSYYCHQATSVGLESTIGTGTATIELEDLKACDLIFVIGANPASNHPRFVHQLKNCKDRGGHVIVINPAKEAGLVRFSVPKSAKSILTGGTKIASLYLQPNIGGDLALFKGIAKALIQTTQINDAFIQAYCEDFDQFKVDIDNTPWQTIIEASGVTKAQIEQCASLYAQSKQVVFAWGMGMTHHTFGSQNVEYIANLAMLRGMLGKRYAGLLPLRGHSNVQGIGTIGVKPVLAQDVFTKIEHCFKIKLKREKGLDTYHALKAAYANTIDCAMIMGGNLYQASPNSPWVAQALDKINFKVFLTTTLNQGHLYGIDSGETLILPVKARDEEPQATTQESMFNYVRMSDGGIQRLDNTRSEVHILAKFAQALMPNSPIDFGAFNTFKNIRSAIADIIPGMAELKNIDVAKAEFHIKGRRLYQPVFKTSSGKARFITCPLPPKNTKQDYPFLLASIRSEGQFNSIIYEEKDSYRHNATRDCLLISPQDIKTLALLEGARVDVISEFGRLNNMRIVAFDITPGNVLAYYPEANVLTGNELDSRSLTPNFKSIKVMVKPTTT